MAAQIIVRAVSYAPEFAPSEGEEELKVCGRLGIEGELFRLMVTQAQAFFLDAQAEQPVTAEGTPVVEPFEVFAGLAEEFKFHLLKLTHTENEVAGRDLVAEGLADLCNTSGELLAGGTEYPYSPGVVSNTTG